MASLRRVGPAAAILFSHSGRSAFMSPPFGSFYGNAGSIRSMSTGGGVRKRQLLAYVNTSRGWVSEKIPKYSKLAEEFRKADEIIKSAARVGQYLYVAAGLIITGLIYVVDRRVDPKVEERCSKIEVKLAKESIRNEEFQRKAVFIFQDHVSNTLSALNGIQSDVNKLRQKIVDNQESEIRHRDQMLKAVKFLELEGYLVVATKEFAALLDKIDAIDQRTSSATASQYIKPEEGCGAAVTVASSPGKRSVDTFPRDDDLTVKSAGSPHELRKPVEGPDTGVSEKAAISPVKNSEDALDVPVDPVGPQDSQG